MPSRRRKEANDTQTSPFATSLMLQLSPYIVEALMSIEQVDILKRRIRVADSARRGRSYYEQLRFVVTEENRIERDMKRGEMNGKRLPRFGSSCLLSLAETSIAHVQP